MHVKKRTTLVALLSMHFIMCLVNTRSASAQQVWFGPVDDLEVNGVVSHPDYFNLYEHPERWQTGISRVDVVMMRAPWFLRMPPERRQKVEAFLEQRHIELAIPLGFVSSETCGQAVEGVGSAKEIDAYPRLMKKAGITINWFTMDEPLFFGHDYDGKNACRIPIAELAKNVASSMRIARSYYPHAKFALTEPPQSLPGGVAEMDRFLAALKIEYGAYPDVVRFDLAWGRNDARHIPWHREMPRMVQMLKSRGIGYSIIYDAGIVNNIIPNTDSTWVASAKANIADWEATVREKPAQVVLQSWSPNPRQITPEDVPTSMTGYLKWYVMRSRQAATGRTP